jgi:S1-C subfamily serine protease
MGNMRAEQMLVNPLIGAGETLLAHPADRVLERARAIIEDARHSRGWIGVTGNDWPGKVGGVLVRKIRSGSPAEQGGLLLGDIIISINGREMNHALDLATAISRHRPGDTIKLGILRGEREIKGLTVRVGDRHQGQAYQTAKIPPSGTLKIEIGKNSRETNQRLLMLQMRKLHRDMKSLESMIKKD